MTALMTSSSPEECFFTDTGINSNSITCRIVLCRTICIMSCDAVLYIHDCTHDISRSQLVLGAAGALHEMPGLSYIISCDTVLYHIIVHNIVLYQSNHII